MEYKEEFETNLPPKEPFIKRHRKKLIIGGIAALILILAIVIPVVVSNQRKSSDAALHNAESKKKSHHKHSSQSPSPTKTSSTPMNSPVSNSISSSSLNSPTPNPKMQHAKAPHVDKLAAYYSNLRNGEGIQNGYPVSEYANLIRIQTKSEEDIANKTRIFVMGDIHGCLDEFNNLLDSVHFDATSDQLILAGDMTSKGPASNEVISRARELNAWCVRGNHDDKAVRFKTYEKTIGISSDVDPKDIMPEGDVPDPLKFKNPHLPLAR